MRSGTMPIGCFTTVVNGDPYFYHWLTPRAEICREAERGDLSHNGFYTANDIRRLENDLFPEDVDYEFLRLWGLDDDSDSDDDSSGDSPAEISVHSSHTSVSSEGADSGIGSTPEKSVINVDENNQINVSSEESNVDPAIKRKLEESEENPSQSMELLHTLC